MACFFGTANSSLDLTTLKLYAPNFISTIGTFDSCIIINAEEKVLKYNIGILMLAIIEEKVDITPISSLKKKDKYVTNKFNIK